jgi:hypothetical protein
MFWTYLSLDVPALKDVDGRDAQDVCQRQLATQTAVGRQARRSRTPAKGYSISHLSALVPFAT